MFNEMSTYNMNALKLEEYHHPMKHQTNKRTNVWQMEL